MHLTTQFIKNLRLSLLFSLSLLVVSPLALAADLAPDFVQLPKDAKLVILPLDVELFELTAGGLTVPKADWTQTATQLMGTALQAKAREFNVASSAMDTATADNLSEYMNLMVAMARTVSLHHKTNYALPTKDGKLDWTFNDVLLPMAKATGAKYALFTWVRDSYASAERKAMMVVMAMLQVGLSGGIQLGNATLIDLETGKVIWFNRMASGFGDLRTPESAKKTVGELLSQFPKAP